VYACACKLTHTQSVCAHTVGMHTHTLSMRTQTHAQKPKFRFLGFHLFYFTCLAFAYPVFHMFKSWVSRLICFVYFIKYFIRVCVFIEYHEHAYELKHALIHKCCIAVT